MQPRALIVALCAVNLLAGAGLGVAVQSACFPPHNSKREFRGGGGPASWLTRELDLTEPQQTQVREIFERREQRFHEIMDPVRPKLEALREDVHEALHAVLDDDQRARLDAMEAKRREHFERRKHRGDRDDRGDRRRGGWRRDHRPPEGPPPPEPPPLEAPAEEVPPPEAPPAESGDGTGD